ncbi:MAG: 3-methyl-2-oxobutanoate dehydrogenase subunit beta [Sulfolobales archaeon]|nr:3-methyl-2-oxobutanoate dehydrogenase subunit beta [Sulfolobales archaeon]MCX8209290.1 3-methyl-2-oxobutanoate dehydrogenase subunit beta [Sulfolobales archaeon]MDW8010926.1 3-methyl-2-oxobutanoate dehydrogenase subunit beta [Sulfolobales archaeon]
MPLTIRDLPREKYVLPGHAACPGCPETIGLRFVGMALGRRAILVVPAGCTSIIQGLMPGSGLAFPIINVAFASADAVASGVAAAKEVIGEDSVVVVWAGDGATADIGFATLSGAAERNENIIHICVDNEAYMNTGIQRSSQTPIGAWTTTTWRGKTEPKKNMPLIMASHGIPYVATASVAYPMDFIEKLRKAASIRGFRYVHLHAPCPIGWRFDPSETIEIARLAIETGIWVLMEVEGGRVTISPPSKPYVDKSRRKPLVEYLRRQGRFREISDELIRELEREIDEYWNLLLKLSS